MLRTCLRIFALLAGLTGCTLVGAQEYRVYDSEESFFNLYDTPEEFIDFSVLKDGTQFSPAALFSPLVAYTTSPPFAVAVRAEAWSDRLNIGSTNPGCSCAWGGVIWHGSYVSPTMFPHIYLSHVGPGAVLAAWTSAGFFGLVPLGESSNFYAFPYEVELFAVGFGYSTISPVPEPASHLLFVAGLIALGLRRCQEHFASVEDAPGANPLAKRRAG